ncbi:solute carrier family 45, member 1/2/4 [Entomortierella parvispora]|uniref:Solute carrier family 45, member 1/2/4 n=1 Tax=Entomortierella parvispora TaxID=205924 RepID=A0A9P3HAP5_9FUNG|nr:solute carrier family 45, member 1/2/4 [Entomortierella parvispora]
MTVAVFSSPTAVEEMPSAMSYSQDSSDPAQRRREHPDDIDCIPSTTLRYERKPGLHGRARIWGPNRTIRFILLTTALMGLQFTWSVEMAYGTPFLLQLGLSKSLMSLVWLAGPLSGLVMQPVVGVLSDRCTSRMGRRRPFLIVGVAAVIVSFLFLGWCKEIMTLILGADYPTIDTATILMAVASIYVLDFAINCVQASCRTLIVDSLPSSQQEMAASWASRLMGIGGILGYFTGNIDLPAKVPIFGDTQIKGLCVIACLFLIATVGLTCITVTEKVMVRGPKSSTSFWHEFSLGFESIYSAIRYLPTRIQHLCNVQFFAWMGWFPFLFYSSTYIAEIFTKEHSQGGTPNEPYDGSLDPGAGVQDAAVRAGSFCLLVYSIVSLAASIILPIFVTPASSKSTPNSSGPFSNPRTTTIPGSIGQKRSSKWRQLAIPRWARPPIKGLTLPKLYTLSLVLASFSWISTLYVHDLYGSTILFSCCGIAWAVSMWAPFSIMGEVISQRMQEEQHQEQLRNRPQSQYVEGIDSIEIVYSKDGYFVADEDEGEEIGMVEDTSGRRYLPVKTRASQEEIVTASSSNTNVGRPAIVVSDSFRSRIGTPSPSEGSSQSRVSNTPGWSVQGKVYAHIDTESETSNDNEDEGDNPRHHLYSIQNEDEQSTSMDGSGQPNSETPPSSQAAVAPEGSSAGALLGIHNMYIVLPQFLVSFLSSLVFAAIEPHGKQEDTLGDAETTAGDPDTIGVMLRFGGVMAGIAALLSLRLWTQPRVAA